MSNNPSITVLKTKSSDVFWEDKYASGHTVRYPYDSIVTFVLRNAPREVPRNEVRILEVGCGTGNNVWFVAREGFDAYGIDGSKSAIEFARNYLQKEGLEADLKDGNFSSLPWENSFFDIIFDRGAITCCSFSDATKVIQEVARTLKPGGKFFFNPYSEAHSSFASGKQLEDGRVDGICEGSMVGEGQICFYGKQQALNLLTPHFEVESIQHLELSDVTKSGVSIHAEWRIIARKP